ncbi:MAG: hypothetical protein JSS87_15545 [Acidobacteria bacterium]|nr:hypothetical protein [Acidobacteriota bacterium]
MSSLSRRNFLELSAAALAAACARPGLGEAAGVAIRTDGGVLTVTARAYVFVVHLDSTVTELRTVGGARIASFQLQPEVAVVDAAGKPVLMPGKPEPVVVEGDRVRFAWKGANGDATVRLNIRFAADAFWISPVTYSSSAQQDVEKVWLFGRKGALNATHYVVPGIAENGAISPIQEARNQQNQLVSLGHSGNHDRTQPQQQWALPSHYFLGMSARGTKGARRDMYVPEKRTPFFCCGFADLPAGDPYLDLHEGKASLLFEYHSSVWHQMRTPGEVELGCTLCVAFGEDILPAITSYYSHLVDAGIVERKVNSAQKNAVALAPQFCTWGTQVVRGTRTDHLSQAFLEEVYAELKQTGMQAKMFSIDDKWEAHYGNLAYDTERFPTFPQFLDRVRAEGHYVGIWTAFMRCESPASLGLTESHMLRGPDGKPLKPRGAKYYIMDTTQPEVAKVLTERAREFMRVCKPDLVKIDFGYELPFMHEGAPKDMKFAGERLFAQALDVVVPALRAENPDVVVMYYQLSPLFVKYFDLHAPDDLYTNVGDYDVEANRRFFFIAPLSQLGVPVYGSSGYNWDTAPSIWFDSVAQGTIGSLNDLKRDEVGEGPTPEYVAQYNGIAQTVRGTNFAEVIPYPVPRAEAATRGAHAHSWARVEKGKVVLIAHRPAVWGDGVDVNDAKWKRFTRVVTSTAPVIVSSRTGEDLAVSRHLAVVGMSDGSVTIARRQGSRARVTVHLLGGKTSERVVPVKDGKLTLAVETHGAGRVPVEWYEVHIV